MASALPIKSKPLSALSRAQATALPLYSIITSGMNLRRPNTFCAMSIARFWG